MSELLSKEVREISEHHLLHVLPEALEQTGKFEEAAERMLGSALRSVLLLAAKKLCLNCIYGIPLTKELDGHLLGGEKLECSAAPIHKMLRGEK